MAFDDNTKEVIRKTHFDWTRQVIIETLEWLRSTYAETGPSIANLEECLQDVTRAELTDECCELCSETQCDSDCPLKGFRDADR